MACFGYPPSDPPDLHDEDIAPARSLDWRLLESEVLEHYGITTERHRGAKMRVVHPDNAAVRAIFEAVEAGEFNMEDVETPRIARLTHRGMEFLLLEEPRRVEIHGRA